MRGYELTNSERGTAGRCPQLHFLAYLLWLMPKRRARALTFGTIWHDLLDVLHVDGVTAAWDFYARMDLMARSLPEEYDPAAPDNGLRGRLVADLDVIAKMLQGYIGILAGVNWELVESEKTRVGRLKTAKGTTSKWVRVTGKIDKIVRIDGELWIIEHKTTAQAVARWRTLHDYNPQGATYVLLQRSIGQPVAGIIYDLALKQAPAEPADFKVNQDGSLSKVLPRNATSAGFMGAVHAAVKRTGKHKPWYDLKYRELIGTDNRFFRQERVRYSDEELDRVERELYVLATALRRRETDLLWNHGPEVHAIRAGDLTGVPGLLRETAHLYPRNSGGCYAYNRACSFMDLCRYQSAEAVEELRPKQTKHSELQEETHASQGPTDTATVPRPLDLW